MATSSTPEAAPKVVKIHRFQIGVNVLIQMLIVVGIVLMLNYVSFRHFKRWDFSRDQKYALSSQSLNVLKNLPKPVKAIVFFSSAGEIAPDVSSLLREYEYSSNKKFKAEIVDPYRNLSRAQELQAKYKFNERDNIVILDIDGKTKFVNAGDMAEFEMPDQMSVMMGQSQPRLKAFKGEQAVTSALLELLEEKPNKLYFATGHGEPALASPELAGFNEILKRQNIKIAPLNLLNVDSIPEDASGIIICGPKYDYTELEIKRINDFWEKKGRFFVLLNPFARTDHLTAWINDQGIMPQEDRILRTGTFLKMDDQGKPQLVSGVIGDPVFDIIDSHSNITKDLEGVSKKLLGPTESLQVDPAREQIAKLHIIPVMKSGEGFWGETDLTSGDEKVFFDPKKDHIGPLNIGIAVEKGGVDDKRVKMDSSRLFVVGNAEMLTDKAAQTSETFTANLSVNVLNWLLDREELIGIPPKEKKSVTISLTEKQMGNLAWGVILLLPGIVAFFGVINWLQRRA